MVILHRIPHDVAERALEAITDHELSIRRDGEETTIPVGRVRQGMSLCDAGVRIRFVLCQVHFEADQPCPPACRAEVVGQIIAVPMEKR